MNREIKFRAWHRRDGMTDNWLIIEDGSTRQVCCLHPQKVMQYTGLKDKNGTEIYEGDIVETRYEHRIQQILWDEDINGFSCYWVYPNGNKSFIALQHPNVFPMKVIGNIYENPELLE